MINFSGVSGCCLCHLFFPLPCPLFWEREESIVMLKHVLKLCAICEMWCKHEEDVWVLLWLYRHTHTHTSTQFARIRHTHHSRAMRSWALMRFNLSNLTLQQTSCKNKLNFLHYSHIHLTRLKSLAMPLNQWCAAIKWRKRERESADEQANDRNVYTMCDVWSFC